MVALENSVRALFETVHKHHLHFTMGEAKILHDFLSWSHGQVSATVVARQFKIPFRLVMQLKKQYR